jgi:hypothetical protein
MFLSLFPRLKPNKYRNCELISHGTESHELNFLRNATVYVTNPLNVLKIQLNEIYIIDL